MSIQSVAMPGEIISFSLDESSDQAAFDAAVREYDTGMREVRETEVVDDSLVDQIRFF